MLNQRIVRAVFLLPCCLALSQVCYGGPSEVTQSKLLELYTTDETNASVENIFVKFSTDQFDEAQLKTIISMSDYCREVGQDSGELQCGPYSDEQWQTVEPLVSDLTDNEYHSYRGVDSAALPDLALDDTYLEQTTPYAAPLTAELVTVATQQNETGNTRAYQTQILSRLVDAGVDHTEGWLSETLGGAKLDLGVALMAGSQWQINHVESLFPFWQADNKALWFVQAGTIFNKDDFHGRDFSHIGVGFRQLTDHQYFGLNAFLDYDHTRYHRRMSIGTEYGVGYGNLSSNFYLPLSNWKDSPDEYEGMNSLVEKPAKGWDLTIESYLPMDTRWKVSGTAGQYLGRYVEHRDGSNPTKNPLRFELNTEFKPTPELAFSLGYQDEQGTSSQWIAGVNYTLSLGGFYEAKRRVDYQSTLPKPDRLTDFVKRDHNIVLEYKQKYSEISIRLPESVVVAENSLQSLANWMEVKGGPDIVSYTWLGSAKEHLSSQSDAAPSFTAPSYRYDGSNNLSLKVRYKLKSGQVKESNTMTITVTDSKFLESIIFEPETAVAGESIVANATLSKAVADIPVAFEISGEYLASLTINGDTPQLKAQQTSLIYQAVTNEDGFAELSLQSDIAQTVVVKAIYDKNEKFAKQGEIEWTKDSDYRIEIYKASHQLSVVDSIFTHEALTAYVFEDDAAVLDLSQFTFQWLRRAHDTQGEFTIAPNATQQTYIMKGDDQGFQFKVKMTKKSTVNNQ